MARDDGAGAGSVLLAFLLGAVTGAAVALLYAPAPGRETRDYLGEKAREGRERATAAAEKGRQVMLSLDRLEHPDFVTATGFANVPFPACLGPLRYADRGPLERDIAHLSAAVDAIAP
jgi:hypothetical protein